MSTPTCYVVELKPDPTTIAASYATTLVLPSDVLPNASNARIGRKDIRLGTAFYSEDVAAIHTIFGIIIWLKKNGDSLTCSAYDQVAMSRVSCDIRAVNCSQYTARSVANGSGYA